MLMSQSVSGHNRAQSTANCIIAIRCLLCRTALRITNHRGHKCSPSLTLLSFKTRIKRPQVFWKYFCNSCNIRGNIQAFLLTRLIWNWRFVDFAVLFCFRCKFSFHEKPCKSVKTSLTVAWVFWTNHNSLLAKNISDELGYRLVCHFFVLITFLRHLWSITEQTHGNMESIC